MPFIAQRVVRTQTIHLAVPASCVLALFEPIGEMRWASGWEPHMVYPTSGDAEAGAVFTTQHPGEPDTIWTLAAYNPTQRRLAYLRVTPGSRVGGVEISCVEVADGTTDVTVTYTFTALSAAGNEFIAGFTEEHYQEYMAAWQTALNHYLLHGSPLEHHQS